MTAVKQNMEDLADVEEARQREAEESKKEEGDTNP